MNPEVTAVFDATEEEQGPPIIEENPTLNIQEIIADPNSKEIIGKSYELCLNLKTIIRYTN